jgi:RNA polymerase sigma factor (sigma-70 family)
MLLEDLELLYDAHASAAYAFALRLSGSSHAAEDLVQHVFCALAQKSPQHIPNPRSFLLRCLYRAWLDTLRRKQTERRLLSQLAQEPVIGPDETPADEAESLAILLKAVHELPQEQRLVVHLKIWERQTFAEIGAILGISSNTAASRYRYATEKLRLVARLQLNP